MTRDPVRISYPTTTPTTSIRDSAIVSALTDRLVHAEEDLLVAEALRARYQVMLGNLLAVIHRDGGHYADEHGDQKAAADAEAVVQADRAEVDRILDLYIHTASIVSLDRDILSDVLPLLNLWQRGFSADGCVDDVVRRVAGRLEATS